MYNSRNIAHRFLSGLAVALAIFAGVTFISVCHKGSNSVFAAGQDDSGPDPSDANMAPTDANTAPADGSQPEQQLQPSTGGAPVYRVAPPSENQQPADQDQDQDQYAPADQQNPNAAADDSNYDDQVDAGQEALDDEQATEPPPALPTYDQPEAPGPNYLWTPGYWGYTPAGYYWVPGVWCAAPYYGALWTPGYWGFYNGFYRFHRGYWGPYIGFYGGINYGFGYFGTGYRGGYWNGNHFYYNTSISRVNRSRVNFVYNRAVHVNNNNRVSYNGGRGGLTVRPRPAERAAMRQTRTPPMTTQLQNQRSASQNRQQFFNQNRGRPAITTAARPIAADRGIQRPAVRPANQTRPQQTNRPGQPQVRPGQPQTRPGQPQTRPTQPQVRPNQPFTRPTQPQVRPNQPFTRPTQPQVRPEQPQLRPNQPQTRPEQPQRPAQQQHSQPQARPQAQRPQARPAARQAPKPDDHSR